MRSIIFVLGLFVLSVNYSSGQTAGKEYYNKDYNWHITIPTGFEDVSAADWGKLQGKGADAIEKSNDVQVVNQAKIIFVFRSGQFNYFESNYQPFDTTRDGGYLETCKQVEQLVYETFMKQMPGATLDSSSTAETIDGMAFHTYKMKIEYPNKMVLRMQMYSRLFGNKEFTANIMYVDEQKGKEMLSAWKNSRFH